MNNIRIWNIFLYIRFESFQQLRFAGTPYTHQRRLKEAIEKLPFGDIRKLAGLENEYRLRVGDLRVLFTIEDDIITINDIKPRGQAYKNL